MVHPRYSFIAVAVAAGIVTEMASTADKVATEAASTGRALGHPWERLGMRRV